MRRMLAGVVTLALFVLFVCPNLGRAQQELPITGWGSLSGRVVLNGNTPEVVDLTNKMMQHNDKACCLDPKAKPIEKIDMTWLVDPKTKGVANVMVWVKVPAGSYLPVNDKLKVRKEEVVMDQPHCAFLPRMAAFQPYYFDKGKEVVTGQSMIVRNSAVVTHNIRAIGHPTKNPGFNVNMIPKSELDITKLLPQPLPISMQCDIHPWMSAKLFVFDHPYYAITKEDGTFEMPIVPAGADVTIMAWHEGIGYLLTNKGHPIKLKAEKNVFDFSLNAPGK
jgi:hypothetical protein